MPWWLWLITGLLLILVLAVALIFLEYHQMKKRFPRPEYKSPAQKPDLDAWDAQGITACWVGHSTVYLNVGGVRILTDPVFSKRIGVKLGPVTIGPKRHTAAALTLDDVAGAVDLILLSHAHMDHVDLPSLKRLASPNVEVVTAQNTGRLLRNMHFGKIYEVTSPEQIRTNSGVDVTSIPVRHWGRRFPWNKGYGWNGYVIEYQGVRLLFAGDTAYTSSFAELADVGPIDVAFFPIGAYAPDSFQGAHCTPEQAWEMFRQSGANWFVPIHWDTFVLSQEPVDEPLRRLMAAAGDEAWRIAIREHGGVHSVPDNREKPQESGNIAEVELGKRL